MSEPQPTRPTARSLSFAWLLHLACSLLPGPIADRLRAVEASALGSRFSRAAVWSLSGAVVSRVVVQLGNILVARTLGKQGYGQLAVVESTIGLFVGLATFGLGFTATRSVSAYRRTDPPRAGRVLAMTSLVSVGSSALLAGLLLAGAPYVARSYLSAPQLAGQLRLAAAFVFFSSVAQVQTGVLVGFEAFRTQALLNAALGLLSFPLLVLGAWRWGLAGCVGAMALNALTAVLLSRWAIAREARACGVPLGFAGWTREWREVFATSLPSVVAGLVTSPTVWLATTFVVREANGYDQMGLFNAANRWYGILLFVPSTVLAPLLPILSEEFAKGASGRLLRIFRATTLTSLGAFAPIALLFALASPLIMRMYGPGFAPGWPALCTMLGAAVVYTLHMNVFQCIFAAGRTWLVVWLNLLWGAVYLTVAWLLRHEGALGLALAHLCAYLVEDAFALAKVLQLIREARPAAVGAEVPPPAQAGGAA